MHLRSHSSLSRIFTSLSDAPSDPRLALSATAIMFMLCQDRLNMDLDRASLKLMVELLEYDDRAHLDNKQVLRVYTFCAVITLELSAHFVSVLIRSCTLI